MQSSSGMEQDLKILYEDNHLIAVFKPHRMLTQGDSSGDLSLFELTKAWIKAKYKKPGEVYLGLLHRLDRPAAGVVLFARTSKGASRLSEQIRSRKVKKTYFTIVEGKLKQKSGRLVDCLKFDEFKKRALIVPEGTKESQQAILNYSLLSQGPECSLLEIDLETGRKHQIRAQLSAMGHPILGDKKYGAKKDYAPGAIALLAQKLEYDHPISKEKMHISVSKDLIPELKQWRNVGL